MIATVERYRVQWGFLPILILLQTFIAVMILVGIQTYEMTENKEFVQLTLKLLYSTVWLYTIFVISIVGDLFLDIIQWYRKKTQKVSA